MALGLAFGLALTSWYWLPVALGGDDSVGLLTDDPAARLHRLHTRAEGGLAALDAQLVRRA